MPLFIIDVDPKKSRREAAVQTCLGTGRLLASYRMACRESGEGRAASHWNIFAGGLDEGFRSAMDRMGQCICHCGGHALGAQAPFSSYGFRHCHRHSLSRACRRHTPVRARPRGEKHRPVLRRQHVHRVSGGVGRRPDPEGACRQAAPEPGDLPQRGGTAQAPHEPERRSWHPRCSRW